MECGKEERKKLCPHYVYPNPWRMAIPCHPWRFEINDSCRENFTVSLQRKSWSWKGHQPRGFNAAAAPTIRISVHPEARSGGSSAGVSNFPTKICSIRLVIGTHRGSGAKKSKQEGEKNPPRHQSAVMRWHFRSSPRSWAVAWLPLLLLEGCGLWHENGPFSSIIIFTFNICTPVRGVARKTGAYCAQKTDLQLWVSLFWLAWGFSFQISHEPCAISR